MAEYQYWKPPDKKTEQEFEEWWLSIKRRKNNMINKEDYIPNRKVMETLEELYITRFFDEVIGLTDPQVNYIQREKDGVGKTRNEMLFVAENKSLWAGMLDKDSKHKHAPIYQTYVSLFDFPKGF